MAANQELVLDLPTPCRAPPWSAPFLPCYGARDITAPWGPCWCKIRDRCDRCSRPACNRHARKVWEEPCTCACAGAGLTMCMCGLNCMPPPRSMELGFTLAYTSTRSPASPGDIRGCVGNASRSSSTEITQRPFQSIVKARLASRVCRAGWPVSGLMYTVKPMTILEIIKPHLHMHIVNLHLRLHMHAQGSSPCTPAASTNRSTL